MGSYMQHTFNLASWSELEDKIRELANSNGDEEVVQTGFFSHFLFRGQGNHGWPLETTLDRAANKSFELAEYYRIAAVAKTQIETFFERKWEDINYPNIAKHLENYEFLRSSKFPHYDYLVYLRHHGFPSPLLDWSRSLYIAAYFAFCKPIGDRIAIYVYQEYAGIGKLSPSNEPQLHVLGPNVRSIPRHFLQQGEYTLCAQYTEGKWCIGRHEDVFKLDHKGQDRLWKITLPCSEAKPVMQRLEEYNLTSFSLFQSEESLLEALARKLIL
jgi:hypothetical protein